MKNYSIQQLAKIAKISSRTLRHYDEIGLLPPSNRDENNYRMYSESDLLKLQQILFYKELSLPLKTIAEVMNGRDFDLQNALEKHKSYLASEITRLTQLQNTINKTILHIKGQQKMLSDEELYEGFSKEQIQEYNAEVKLKYDPKLVAESNRKIKSLTKEQWNKIKQEGSEITLAIADMMEKYSPDSVEVQELIAKHFAYMQNFFTVTKEIYNGLGQLYIQDARFTAFYDKVKPELAYFLQKGIAYFCQK